MSDQTETGSTKLPINQLLEMFSRKKLNKRTNELIEDIPKLENIRISVVRGLFKGIKNACSMSQPGKGLHRCYYPCIQWTMNWHNFQVFINFFKHKFKTLIKRKRNQPTIIQIRSKTANLLRDLLEDEHLRYAYGLYIEIISSWNSPEVFCKMFRISCCDGEHSEDCYQKWGLLINFLHNKMDPKWISNN